MIAGAVTIVLIEERGKSSIIIFANDTAEAKKVASNLISSTIQGSIVRSLLVEEKLKEKSND